MVRLECPAFNQVFDTTPSSLLSAPPELSSLNTAEAWKSLDQSSLLPLSGLGSDTFRGQKLPKGDSGTPNFRPCFCLSGLAHNATNKNRREAIKKFCQQKKRRSPAVDSPSEQKRKQQNKVTGRVDKIRRIRHNYKRCWLKTNHKPPPFAIYPPKPLIASTYPFCLRLSKKTATTSGSKSRPLCCLIKAMASCSDQARR